MQYKLNFDLIIAQNEGVRTRKEGFGLLLASRTAPAMCINEDAVEIWNLCNGINSIKNIIEIIASNAVIDDKEKLEHQVRSVISKLLDFNLLIIKK